jgi:hypothetical protein
LADFGVALLAKNAAALLAAGDARAGSLRVDRQRRVAQVAEDFHRLSPVHALLTVRVAPRVARPDNNREPFC